MSSQYRIAVVGADGAFEIIDTVNCRSDADANAYAARYYADYEWYVLDASGRNINGGLDG